MRPILRWRRRSRLSPSMSENSVTMEKSRPDPTTLLAQETLGQIEDPNSVEIREQFLVGDGMAKALGQFGELAPRRQPNT